MKANHFSNASIKFSSTHRIVHFNFSLNFFNAFSTLLFSHNRLTRTYHFFVIFCSQFFLFCSLIHIYLSLSKNIDLLIRYKLDVSRTLRSLLSRNDILNYFVISLTFLISLILIVLKYIKSKTNLCLSNNLDS